MFFSMVFAFASCDNNVQIADIRVRASVISNGSGSVHCVVYVEGPDGNSLSGAVVTVRNETNRVTLLPYDMNSGSYTAAIEETDKDTVYNIEAVSILRDNPVSLQVPYSPLFQKPDVTVFQDSRGESVLSGQNIAGDVPVQIAWSSCGEEITYNVTVKTAVKTFYSVSTGAQTVTIPAAALSTGTYVLEITAQKIHGDPYFRDSLYYSLSTTKSAGLSFYVD